MEEILRFKNIFCYLIFSFSNLSTPFYLQTDASDVAIGLVLIYQGEKGEKLPISFVRFFDTT